MDQRHAPRVEHCGWPPNRADRLRVASALTLPFVLALVLASVPCRAARTGVWHQRRSPYRALFSIVDQPNHERAGLVVRVPVCGLGDPGGLDVAAFDQRGNSLHVLPLGPTIDHSALALAQPVAGTESLFVYFGSGTRAGANPQFFLPTLTVDIRTRPEGRFDSWRDVSRLVERSERKALLLVDTVSLTHNPVDSDDEFIMVFDGYLNSDTHHEETLMLVSDDAGYLFVDGKLVIERNGRHHAQDAVHGQSRATVRLDHEPVPFRCVVVEGGGAQAAVLGRWQSAREKAALTAADFVRAGRTRLQAVESRRDGEAIPLFRHRVESYMRIGDLDLTEVIFSTLTGTEAVWQFADGPRLQGAEVARVFVGLDPVGLRVGVGDIAAHGTVRFPENAPRQRQSGSPADFSHYAELMAEGAAGDLRPGTLAGYAAFFALRQRHPAGIPVYRKLLGSASVQGNGRRDTLLALARATAAPEPERAAEAYAELFRDRADPEDWDTVAREFFDLLLYRIGNVNRARTVLGHVDRTRKEGDPLRLNMALDLALVQGDTETARDLIQRLQTQRSFGRDQPSHVVRANALGVQVSNLQEQGFPQDAYAALLDWMALPTEDRASGRFTLGRARLWRSWGWTEGAIRDLDSVMALDPILPFLADVQLEKALALQDLGRDRESRSLMLLITREYPNHPAAAAARENLGLPPAREPIP